MKFNMIIGGVETLFPKASVCYSKEDNEIVIYFLNTKKEDINKLKETLKTKKISLKIENNFIIFKLKRIQYAFDITEYKNIVSVYDGGGYIGFAFEDEDGKLIDIETPSFYK